MIAGKNHDTVYDPMRVYEKTETRIFRLLNDMTWKIINDVYFRTKETRKSMNIMLGLVSNLVV